MLLVFSEAPVVRSRLSVSSHVSRRECRARKAILGRCDTLIPIRHAPFSRRCTEPSVLRYDSDPPSQSKSLYPNGTLV
jgi:hypothetical protein